ncbi:hypothetical protein [uncultured Eubacterium sp.]|uniref:hypothetical protein n=1 Tax=uncultured Eubacterium sp. TaxID=165185 RepID=UPI002593D835|nr:hypothetical protein [uncultured Eubacterium sp.]
MLRRNSIFVFFVVLILAIAILAVLSSNSTRKGGEGTGMFEVNSNSLSIYVNDTKKTYSDKEQNEIVAHMKNFETVSNSDIKFVESFNIKLDCNNDIGIMYLRSQDKICYLKNKDKAYQLSKEDYDFIINKVEEK